MADESAAATKVQAAARGRAARKQVKAMKDTTVEPAASKLVDGIISDLEASEIHPAARALIDKVLDDLEADSSSMYLPPAASESSDIAEARIAKTRSKRVSAPGRAPATEEEAAAVKMQALARGRNVRRQRKSNASATASLPPKRKNSTRKKKMSEEDRAAARVQAAARGKIARKKVDNIRKKKASGKQPKKPSTPELDPLSSKIPSLPVGSIDENLGTPGRSARRTSVGLGVSPRVTAHSLTPIGSNTAPSSSPSTKTPRTSLEVDGYLKQIESLQQRVASLETEKEEAYKLLETAGIAVPKSARRAAKGDKEGTRRSSAAMVSVEKELNMLKEQNAELRKALQQRDATSKRKASGSTSARRAMA